MPDDTTNNANKDTKNPFEQILQKLKTLEDENKTLKANLEETNKKFKDFSDFNASLLNMGNTAPTGTDADKAKKERMAQLDKMCRKGEY